MRGVTETETAAHLCVSPRSAGLKQEVNTERTTTPAAIFPLTQRAFDSFVWAHTLASNHCFSFCSLPPRGTYASRRTSSAYGIGTLRKPHQTQGLPPPYLSAPVPLLIACREAVLRACGPTSVTLSPHTEISTVIIKTHRIFFLAPSPKKLKRSKLHAYSLPLDVILNAKVDFHY